MLHNVGAATRCKIGLAIGGRLKAARVTLRADLAPFDALV
jgi:hypothetical protein